MGFFAGVPVPPPEPEEPRRRRPVWAKPEAALAGVAPGEILLARSDDVAIGVSGFRAYPSGFELTLVVLLRSEDRRGRIFQRLGRTLPGEELDDEFLRFGILFADGTSATNLGGWHHPRPDEEPTPPILSHNGGGGGGRRYDMHYWVWPLPPPGPMTIVGEWPARGIPETRAEIDTQPIRDAATRAIQVFPED
jgi:hypothetical protein